MKGLRLMFLGLVVMSEEYFVVFVRIIDIFWLTERLGWLGAKFEGFVFEQAYLLTLFKLH